MSETSVVVRDRGVAAAIDLLPPIAVGLIVGRLLGAAVGLAVASIVHIAYFARLEGRPEGQTIGKRVMGLSVVDADTGAPLVPQQALVRAAVRYVSGVACFAGFLWAYFDKDHRTWHDVVGHTLVTRAVDSGDQAS